MKLPLTKHKNFDIVRISKVKHKNKKVKTMPQSPESAPRYPSQEVREDMHADNNDWERNHDFRGHTETLPEGGPTLADGTPITLSNPAYRLDTVDEHIAEQAPNVYVELANLQNRHDEDEKAAIEKRIEEIGKPGLSISKRRELSKLAERMTVIDPNGDMAESHKKFKDANIDALIENAHAEATKREAARAFEDDDPKFQALANVFHEVWLRTRNKRTESGAIFANGEREAREKKTIDEAWADTQGRAVVDIANTGFVELPEDWKAENAAAAEVIVELIDSFGDAEKIDLNDPEIYAKCGTVIHNRWLDRNTYAHGGELDVDFSELPADEQEKDLEQLRIALELFKPDKDSVLPRPFETRALQTVNNWALERGLPIRSKNGDLIDPTSAYYEDQRAMLLSGHR